MHLSTKILRNQIKILKPIITNCSIEMSRSAQDKLGKIMMAGKQKELNYSYMLFSNFEAAFIRLKEINSSGVILYLHGGGYVAGDLNYAKGFGSLLAAESGIDVFCPAYRLAPENPFPAALEDAEEAYCYLLKRGYPPGSIALAGESAGGGLIFSLALKVKQRGIPLPACITAISPWSDLTQHGASYETNSKEDPSMTKERLDFFAKQYIPESEDPANPLASPVYGDLNGLPPSRLYVGGSEVMLDDAVNLYNRLIDSGCEASLSICPGMWHAYILYGTEDGKDDFNEMINFIKEKTDEHTSK
ncbi:MAG: alpha/beta hydrolase [Clostridiales bacterium]|jgi:alpha/beta hydrolase fold-3 domain protein|nr:alpha/beta hydrolase [Clostridiales bacterium]